MELRRENRADWFASYISTYLLGDIRTEGEEGDENEFLHFLRILASRNADTINYTAISSEANMSSYRVKKLISLLVSCGIIFALSPYSGNTLKTIVKTPRMYFTDSGLYCYLLGIGDVKGFLAHPLAGRIFESYAVSEMIRNARNNGDYSPFYFLREETKNSKYGSAEIDLIKEKNGMLYPIEIKLNASPTAAMAKWFSAIPEAKRGMGTIICMHKERTMLSRSLLVMPVSMI